MKVLFLPLSRQGNPYIDKLIDAVTEQGATVIGQEAWTRWPLLMVLRLKPDVVHLHWLRLFSKNDGKVKASLKLLSFLVQILLVRIWGKGVVFTVHNLIPHESALPRLDRAATKWVILIAHKIIVHGDHAKLVLGSALNLPTRVQEKMATVMHGHYDGSYRSSETRAVVRERLELRRETTCFYS